MEAKRSHLRHDEQFSIGIGKKTILHGGVCGIKVNGNSGLHGRVAIAGKGDDAIEKIRFLFRERQRIPAKLIGRGGGFSKRSAAEQASRNLFIGAVSYRGPNAIGPGAAVQRSRRGKWRAAELLGVKAEGMLLRRILALRQRSHNCLGGEFVAEAGLVRNLT